MIQYNTVKIRFTVPISNLTCFKNLTNIHSSQTLKILSGGLNKKSSGVFWGVFWTSFGGIGGYYFEFLWILYTKFLKAFAGTVYGFKILLNIILINYKQSGIS